ncbi:twin-arginine translocase subunit TatC [Patulibacter sp.]|uniref:twin-arginine translocase subunit TatC n=1 Tax=Patulibacter sp. TaxID=1912859 RepID=UPI002722C466|nr:twin-arginine translocase subunit TatC [Patulibacter sp.]MDO9410159.1 twin-arginine translocase subunit TatC [Patulibacter sp.]
MAKLRPVSHEDRFTLVEHLTELRTRIITMIAIFIVAFAFAYWQNGNILEIVNSPLEKSQKVNAKKCTGKSNDSQQSVCFERSVAAALRAFEPLVVAPAPGDSRTEALQKAQALKALRTTQELAPTSTTRKPVTLGVAEPFFQTLNVAMYGALVLSLPLLLYQLYAFLIPAFTSRERRAIVPLLIGVPFLFYAGVAFAYFLALPRAVDFLQNFNADNFDILVQAKDYYKFVALFVAGSGLIFQVPVLVIALSRLGILSAKQMRKKRGFVAIVAAVVAAVITPTPDAVTMLLMMAPLVVLFELSVAVASLLERRAPVGGVSGRLSEWREFGEQGYREEDDVSERDDEDDDRPRPPRPAPASSAEEDPDDDDEDFGPGGSFDHFALDDEDDDEPPHGEDPDPALLGDPAGPRPAGPGDVVPKPAPEDWESRADALDAADPYAEDDAPGTRGAGSGDGSARPEGWEAEADALDAADPYARADDADRPEPRSEVETEDASDDDAPGPPAR